MNPLTNVKNINKLNERELELGIQGNSSWHAMYKHSAWIFIGGLNYELSEGDIICVFSQYGEIACIHLVRDKKTGKSKGFCFLCYEDQRSTILAVDNFNGIKLSGRIIRVDHCDNYKPERESPPKKRERGEANICSFMFFMLICIVGIYLSDRVKCNFMDHDFDANTSEPLIFSNRDVEIMSAFVLIRGHIIIGPESQMEVDEGLLDKLLNHLFKIQTRISSNGRLIYPAMEERDLGCESLPTDVQRLCQAIESKCLSLESIVSMIPNNVFSFSQFIARLCPLILFRQYNPICDFRSYLHHHSEDSTSKLKLVEPSSEKVWGFGILFVTLSIVVSMGGLIALPFLSREFRRIILTLFEGLAVGGLAGSAVIHLFPQAFEVSDKDYRNYFPKTLLIFAGIYLFYIIERILKLFTSLKGKGRKKRSPSYREEEFPIQLLGRLPLTPQTSLRSPTNDNKDLLRSFKTSSSFITSPKSKINMYLATFRDTNSAAPEGNSSNTDCDNISRNKQSYVDDMAGRRKDQYTSTRRIIDPVAWMIVLGDASLNFIDGLSIGAAFDRNILAGISISVAVMLEEVPHRLGTFAVLIRAGMEMKQSFIWILISACALYPGLILGVFLGDVAKEGSPYIFALSAGMFLYMALVDVMKEMNGSMENASRKGVWSSFQILALQNLGIVIAVIVLSVLALYEKDMDFEAFEIKELTEYAIQ